ncbi:MAG TPA: helix-turn-helix transcriptional regulator [Polyangiaceae bacterium]|nr:helix-turn-helix transcriptional regulator [Polyangiaceae bacterium]
MADDTSTKLAQNLKRLREAQGLSQASLAELSGVPRPTIAHLESGQANPTLHVVLRVAAALGVSVDGLVTAGEAPVEVMGPRGLPTRKAGRVRRVQMVSPRLSKDGPLREGEAERIVVKEGGRFTLPAPSAPEALICERGDFVLQAGGVEVQLGEEQVAILRDACEVSSEAGGVLYRLSGRAP